MKVEERERKKTQIVTIGEFFGIKYYLKYYDIELTPSIEHFMNQTYDQGFNPSLYTSNENASIRKIISLILYSNPKPIENLIR